MLIDGAAPIGDQSGVPGFVGRRQQPNLVLSPHVAANAASAQQAQQQVMLANLEAMLEGGELRNRIA